MTDFQLPVGFRFSGVAAGIKKSGKPDVSLIVGDGPLTAAGVYTQNQVVAAPVLWCRQRTPSDSVRAVITNSGNANACTGDQGLQDAQTMCRQVAAAVAIDPDDVLVMSTGIIGQPLPMEVVCRGIDAAADQLGDSAEDFVRAADAILTTDQGRKVASRVVVLGDQPVRIAAMAKGAGMIAPNMATLLAVVLTDAKLTPTQAQELIAGAADRSFNSVSVDGHTSTNDTLLMLSSGASGAEVTAEHLPAFAAAVEQICQELAWALVADGEGATHVMRIQVTGAASDGDAKVIARAVGESLLVKTAITGGDPNWGRIVSAAGAAGPKIEPTKTALKINGTPIYSDGGPTRYDAATLSQSMKAEKEVLVELTVGQGSGQATRWASDLTVEYVRFNSEYTT
ncbi:bifunctional glutamate N-acetyltransferase/amino-acid acetyltransferase ArgJ [Roseiconus nitratireducens]|uniref:Arginine biosynthesis bifunctional protein ArgJ n=1 Tax=Roseiconus nitratireducens TaxID=2605748 RepID=A0A5M6D5A2_9BACT|nr:bifunctional glutamate N-acetyltransferase/amino-acid acetyltransferase ArgJ [Roseiconus nitratireducens]KAA5541482.1 bifunctional glutamate N-acetyltransferase/amino-acid acetyltransferase ArgJ [Roseiconus nitratireducens]